MSMGPLLKYRLSIGHYLSGIFARQQDAPPVCGVCSGGRQIATPGDRIAMLFAAVHESAVDAVDGSSTGTRVPWMWALLRLPRFGGATHADDQDNRFRHCQIGVPGSRS